MINFPQKDADEVLDYRVDWSARLSGDVIVSSTFTLVTAAGLTITNEDLDSPFATVWVSGGTPGAEASILNRVVTAGGRQYDETLTIPIEPVPAPVLLIPLAKIKSRLQIEDGGMDAAGIEAQDDAVTAAFQSAIEFVEKQTHLTLAARSFALKTADWCIAAALGCAGERFRWSCCSPVLLERAPIQAIENIEYLGRGEITMDALDPADYSLQPTPVGGVIHLNEGVTLPDLERRWDAVQITYRAGYEPGELPHALANALILLTGYWFNNRDAVGTERVYELELGAESLMTAFRLYK